MSRPVPHRGKKTSRRMWKYGGSKIAEIKDLSFKEVAARTTQNAKIYLDYDF